MEDNSFFMEEAYNQEPGVPSWEAPIWRVR
jgi:hypothetical protein